MTKSISNPGASFHCTHCGNDSIAKKENVMEGWRCVGTRLVCALCGAPLAAEDVSSAGTSALSDASASAKRSLDGAASFLGTSLEELAPKLDLGESDGRFCKNCEHFLRHPFQSRCLLHDRDVEPMEDCSDFSPVPLRDREESDCESS